MTPAARAPPGCPRTPVVKDGAVGVVGDVPSRGRGHAVQG